MKLFLNVNLNWHWSKTSYNSHSVSLFICLFVLILFRWVCCLFEFSFFHFSFEKLLILIFFVWIQRQRIDTRNSFKLSSETCWIDANVLEKRTQTTSCILLSIFCFISLSLSLCVVLNQSLHDWNFEKAPKFWYSSQ
jgi:preprotein translocase subunit SecG